MALVNARRTEGGRACVRVQGGLIESVDEQPQGTDRIVDLRGDRLLPGLINAHDHLQLNGLPRLKFRERYRNASEWIDDIRPRLQTDPLIVANRAVPREERLLLGAVKNLLSGVTTVAHHDPLFPALLDAELPIRVVTRYSWSHSLALDGEAAVCESYRNTPPDEPWIIHAAEGTDSVAAAEFAKLDLLGCIGSNSVLVHGLALEESQHRTLASKRGALAWCPGSNLHLFGATLDLDRLEDTRHVLLGSDSRLSGGFDLLEELRTAGEITSLTEAELVDMVTERAARAFRLADRGAVRRGMLADLVVLRAGVDLSQAERVDIVLVLLGGQPRYANDRYRALFDGWDSVQVEVDGQRRWLSAALVARLRGTKATEPGLVLHPADEMQQLSPSAVAS
jgi:cytosine/adenosine deaminase-related metal-dependent hydrolase